MESLGIPEGYKETAVGVIPVDWEVKIIGELGETYSGLSGKKKEHFGQGAPYIPYKNVFQNGKVDISFLDYVDVKDDERQHKVKYGDIFFTVSSEISNEVGMSSVLLDNVETMYLNSFCFGFRLKNQDILSSLFSSYLFRSENIRKELTTLAQGSTRYNISKSELIKLLIPIPALSEQQKIAEILSTWDEAITNCKNTLSELLIRKSWLAYHLLFNKKNSLFQLSNLVERVKKPLTPEPEKLYRQIGIRSHAKGIFYKEEVSGLSLGNKSVFHIEPNCFIVNIVFAWEHAIAKTTINEVGMIASHRFPMFRPFEDKIDLDYLLHFFKSKKGKDLLNLASPGGAGRNKTLGQSEFLKLQIPVPNLNEQKHIAKVLDTADSEILLCQQKLKALQLQKKGLMQQLLTGKTRVKIN